MRITSVTFENLNSLYGTHTIDFDAIPDGLFLITGPTGSGKTTILDAITLALYGKTPRQDKVAGKTNEVMSKGTSTCRSQLTFTEGGHTYQALWEQTRRKASKKNPEGSLEAPRRSLYQDGKQLELSNADVPKHIEQILGMKYEQFTKAVLLAQGGFSEFLKANENEKSALLTEMTDTGIYERISQAVFVKTKNLKDDLEIQNELIDQISIKTPEELAQITQSGKEAEMNLEVNSKQRKELSDQDNQWKIHENWGQKQDELQRDRNELAQIKTTHTDDLERLKQDEALQPAYEPWKALQQAQAQHAKASEDVRSSQALVSRLQEAYGSAKTDSDRAVKDYESWQSERKQEEDTIRQARSIQSDKLPPLETQISNLKRQIQEKKESIKTEQEAISSAREAQAQIKAELAEAEKLTTDHPEDENLRQLLGTLPAKDDQQRKAGQTLQDAKNRLQDTTDELAQAEDALKKAQEDVRNKQDALASLTSRLEAKQAEIAQLPTKEKIDADLETVRKANQIVKAYENYTEARTQLADGKPCPLCGSLEHPYAQGQIPETDPREEGLLNCKKQLETLQTQAQELENKETRAQTTCQFSLKSEEQAQDTLASAASRKQEAENQLSKATEEFDALTQEISRLLESWGFTAWSKDIQTKLEQRAKAWDAAQRTLVTGETSLQAEQTKEAEARKRLSQISTGDLEAELQKTESDKQALETTLKDLLAGSTIESLSDSIATKEQTEKQKLDTAQEAEQNASNQLASAQGSLESARKAETNAATQEAEAHGTFELALRDLGLPDEQSYLDQRLSDDKRTELQELREQISDTEKDLAGRAKGLGPEPPKPEIPHEQVQSELQRLDTEIDGLHKQIAEAGEAIKTDEANRKKRKEKEAERDKAEKEYQDWEQLNSLIGSSDGAKFRRFAQSISFRALVGHANGELAKLTDRYRLRSDDEHPLEFFVYDAQQNVERPASNLSGGESFLVSLALALALSTFSMGRIRIDSLFLDEGFGTLDDKAIQSAVNALSNLQSHGKTIGIISHVDALQDAIPSKIQVIKLGGGHSKLEGCGVRKEK